MSTVRLRRLGSKKKDPSLRPAPDRKFSPESEWAIANLCQCGTERFPATIQILCVLRVLSWTIARHELLTVPDRRLCRHFGAPTRG